MNSHLTYSEALKTIKDYFNSSSTSVTIKDFCFENGLSHQTVKNCLHDKLEKYPSMVKVILSLILKKEIVLVKSFSYFIKDIKEN